MSIDMFPDSAVAYLVHHAQHDEAPCCIAYATSGGVDHEPDCPAGNEPPC